MNPKANPLLLAMFTLMCATIPAAGVIPSVIAQEYTTSLGEDFAGSIVSDVLDGDDDEVDDEAADDGIVDQDLTDTAAASNPNQDETTVDQAGSNQFGDDTNTQIAIPITEQDQRAENRAANLDLEIVRIQQPPPTTPPPGNAPPAQTCEPYGPDYTLENGECVDRQEPAQTCEPYGPDYTLENGECVDRQEPAQT